MIVGRASDFCMVVLSVGPGDILYFPCGGSRLRGSHAGKISQDRMQEYFQRV